MGTSAGTEMPLLRVIDLSAGFAAVSGGGRDTILENSLGVL
jgi:hypothetical protein